MKRNWGDILANVIAAIGFLVSAVEWPRQLWALAEDTWITNDFDRFDVILITTLAITAALMCIRNVAKALSAQRPSEAISANGSNSSDPVGEGDKR